MSSQMELLHDDTYVTGLQQRVRNSPPLMLPLHATPQQGAERGLTGTSDDMLARLEVLPGPPSELLLGVRLP
jgi:hypothetical protein